MDEPIDLAAERRKRDAPDPAFVRRDDFGRPLHCFTCSYEMAGGRWCFDLWAYDRADAEARMAAIRGSATVDGQCIARVET